jgi:microsomal dipeptidase-like Zn-dependent dipeptidase
MNDYTDLRKVVETMQARGVPEVRMRKLAIGNYARVLKAAFAQARG